MLDKLLNELSGRGLGVFLGMIAGGLLAIIVARWRRYKQRRSILCGDARDTIEIQQHIIDPAPPGADGEPGALHIRSLGQAELNRVVPNGHLAAVLLSGRCT